MIYCSYLRVLLLCASLESLPLFLHIHALGHKQNGAPIFPLKIALGVRNRSFILMVLGINLIMVGHDWQKITQTLHPIENCFLNTTFFLKVLRIEVLF